MLIPLRSDERTNTPPVITALLILANIVAFVYQKFSSLLGGRDLASIYGAIPYEITHLVDIYPPSPHPVFLGLITYMFLHGGILHIIGNMLFLNAFAPNLEDVMGHLKFLAFYVLCGVIAVLVYVIPNFNSRIPLVGASGAIAGVMGAHFRLLPGTRIRCLFFIFRISLPAVVILFPWILLQVTNMVMHEQSNIAFLAHVGGFAFGLLTSKRFDKRKKRFKYLHED